MERVFSQLGVDEKKDVVVYDQYQGQAAGRLWWLLRWLGHDRVRLLDGGLPQWLREGYSTRSGQETNDVARFVARPRKEMIAELAHVEKVFSDPDWLLVDGRSVERHEGKAEPIDPVAGSIPGSKVRFHMENLEGPDKSKWKSPEVLAKEFAAVLGNHPPERTVFYCGSGITAIHNLLALEMIGVKGVKLYPGSWSEWIRDPSHPVYPTKK